MEVEECCSKIMIFGPPRSNKKMLFGPEKQEKKTEKQNLKEDERSDLFCLTEEKVWEKKQSYQKTGRKELILSRKNHILNHNPETKL